MGGRQVNESRYVNAIGVTGATPPCARAGTPPGPAGRRDGGM